jgi:hypothetical protein
MPPKYLDVLMAIAKKKVAQNPWEDGLTNKGK